MKNITKALLCASLGLMLLLQGCSGGEVSEPETTAEQTTAEETTLMEETTAEEAAATNDSASLGDSEITYDNVEIKKNVAEIESKLDELIEAQSLQGSVYAKLGNDFEYLKSMGVANEGEHRDNSLYTRFYTGSVTKQFTAAAVMKLKEQELIDIDSTIEKYFPKCAYASQVTIKQLLTMTSGIPDYVDRESVYGGLTLVNGLDGKVSKENSEKENKSAILNYILSQSLRSDAGRFNYSDSNFYLLGEIIEQASGTSYEEYLDKELFQPLRMTKSGFMSDDFTSTPYGSGSRTEKLLLGGAGYSSLGLITNVSDLLRWAEGIRGGSVLSQDSLSEMFTDYGYGYGYGVFVNGGHISSVGSIDAYSAKFSFTTDGAEIFAALSNHKNSDPNFVHRLFKLYLLKYRN